MENRVICAEIQELGSRVNRQYQDYNVDRASVGQRKFFRFLDLYATVLRQINIQ